MAKFRLAFGLHNHQPVGNFEAVFEESHQKAYQPFLQLASEFPSFRFSLHQSGILWRWQESSHPDYFEQVGQLVDSGRLELMTGGFYEPILISIPERDAVGQIEMLNQYIRDHFEVEPKGLWLTERIWEPHLPKLLKQTGVKYLPIDDTHFIYAGFEASQLTGPFVTEHEGHQVTLLPIQKRLRYLIPFGTVEEVIAELQEQAERDPAGLAVYADDGEKFGVWPDTHQHCYQDKWLREFFEAIEANSDWLEVIPLSEATQCKPAGRAYLPSASYAEMLEWALPMKAGREYEQMQVWMEDQEKDERFGRFVRGGHWRGFLVKYEESNLMHKRMLDVSARLSQAQESEALSEDSNERARDRLYAGQCNCPYWHGVFGGLYLPHVRQAIHSALIEADALLSTGQPTTAVIETTDYDHDGHDEVVYRDQAFTAVVKPSRGGILLDLAMKHHGFNPIDTLTRRREAYHAKLDRATISGAATGTSSIHDLIIAKEEGLKDFLVEDWYLKRCFVDHFFTGDVNFNRFRGGKYGEEGDFILEPFEYIPSDAQNEIVLARDGHLWRSSGVVPVRMEKRFRFDPQREQITIDYTLTADCDGEVWTKFGIETNCNFQAGHAEDRFILVDNHRAEQSFLDSDGAYDSHHSWAMIDQYRDFGMMLGSNRPGALWHCPIFTVSLSEGGFERVYQGTTMVKVFDLPLTRQAINIGLTMSLGKVSQLSLGEYKTALVRP